MAVELNDAVTRRFTPTAWVDAFGALTALSYGWLAWASHAPPVPLLPYFAVMGVAWIALIGLVLHFRTSGESPPLGRIVAWCLIFRAIGLVSLPILEDDHFRYLWDGHIFASTGNPYLRAPMSYFDDATVPLAFQHVLDGINNPDVPTLYPPLCQVVFLVGHWLAPGELLPIKLVLIGADLATLYLLLQLVPRERALLWAWCPLLVQETAFSAHPDVLGILFTMAAFHAARHRWPRAAALAAALAIASKLFSVLLLPLLARHLRLRDWGLIAAVLAAIHGPFVLAGGSTESTGLLVFAAGWEFNSTLFAVLADRLGAPVAKAIGVVAVLAVCLMVVRRRRDAGAIAESTLPRGDLVLAVFFLFAPVVNPWYLLWLLPFLCAFPTAWGFCALGAVSLSYIHGLFIVGLPAYHHPGWVRPLELGLVAIGLAVDVWHRSFPSSQWPGFRRVMQKTRLEGPMVTHRNVVRMAAFAASILLVLSSGVAFGSGSYSGRPSNPGISIDRASYELGKKVFAGQFPRSDQAGDAAVQLELLENLQNRLPLKARAGVSLVNYAGQLDDEQVEALQYFLKKRYKVE